MTTFLLIAGAYVLFTAAGIRWFFHRLGDKHGKDKRWWVRTLDWILLTPLFPYFLLFAIINR